MNKRRTIYKGFNKRKKTKHIKIIILATTVCLVGGYGYIKIKDSNIKAYVHEKIFKSDENTSSEDDKFLGYEDYDLDKDAEKEEAKQPEQNEQVENEEIKIATVDPWSVYSIQVASVDGDKDMNKIEQQLLENKIPFSVVEINGTEKVQTYASFEEEITRGYLENVKELFPDAFISKIEIPVLSLEYTSKYSYIESISTDINELIKTFEDESIFWTNTKEEINLEKYNEILTKRKEIILNIEKGCEKIDYKTMGVFKDNLIKYTEDVSEKIDSASKAANEKQYNISQSLYLSSMQGYMSFINSIKEA